MGSNRRPPVAVYRTGLIGKFKIKFKIACSTGSDRLTDRFTGVLTKNSDSFKVVPRCEINENFGMSYAYINVKDHTKATMNTHAYKYNSNKRAYKYHSHNRAYKYNSH